MTHQLHTEIEIDATPETVWTILTDLDAYPDRNPFITSSDGDVVEGTKLVNRMEPPGGKPMTFTPIVTEVDEHRAFEWLGRLGVPGAEGARRGTRNVAVKEPPTMAR